MELFGIEKKLNRVIAPNSFKFVIIFYSHTNQIQVIKNYITQKFENTKHTTLDLNNTTYQKLSSQLYSTENGFVFIDRLEKLFENEDLYHGFNQRRDKIAKHKINLICFAHIDNRKVILKNFASLTPDLWEFKNAVLEITEKGEVQEVKNLENWNFNTLGGTREIEAREEIKKLEISLERAKSEELQINLRLQLLSLYRKVGDLKKADEHGNTLLSILDEKSYKNRDNLSNLFNELGLFYQDKGDLKKALEYQKKNIEIKIEIYDNENHPNLATAYGNLALIYQANGDLEKALEYQLKKKKMFESYGNEKHSQLATAYGNLALIYKAKGDLKKALAYQQKTIEIFQEIYDTENHPNLATAYGNLSGIYQNKGDLEKALEYQQKSIEIYEEIYDTENHPNLATVYGNLANIYREKGDLEKALEYQLKDIGIQKEIYDNENHPNLMIAYWVLGTIYYSLKNSNEAKKFIKKAYKIYQFNFPNGHPVYNDLEGWYKYVCS